jgi:predicted nucleic acid-binding protein
MAIKVVDASALAALLFGELEAEIIADQLDGHRLIAPRLLAFELANVCLTKCHRHPGERAKLLAAFHLRDRLAIEEVTVEHGEAIALALTTKLTTYDASYLWLAQKLNAELVTLDQELKRAAHVSG